MSLVIHTAPPPTDSPGNVVTPAKLYLTLVKVAAGTPLATPKQTTGLDDVLELTTKAIISQRV